jgi:hypothetical protein
LAVDSALTSEQPTQVFPYPGQTVLDYSNLPTTIMEQEGTDWLAVGLGVLALVALLGLIPLWYFVYVAYAG